MSDLISRQAAIDIVEFECGEWRGLARTIVKAIKQLPSAQPDVPEMNVGDMIYRQAAMEMLMAQNVIIDGSEYHNGFNAGVSRAQEVIRNLPPVQPTITHEQAIDYLHETGWLQNHDRILTESKMMMPVQPIIYCEKCLYKKICSWRKQGAEFCSFGERGEAE